jgi:DNA polymerase
MESEGRMALDWHVARALLEWQLEMGVDEAPGEAPVDRFAVEAAAREAAEAARAAPATAAPPRRPAIDPVAEAEAAASAAADLTQLRAALAGFEHSRLKRGARNLVFGEGPVGAPVMVIGEAPGREEDIEGRPFAGASGALLDRMLGAIGMARGADVYLAPVLPWRPPQNREPRPEDIAMLLPFLRRQIALVQPQLLVVMGNIACQALLGRRGLTRLRGTWAEVETRPALPMMPPEHLLRQPLTKREAWADLLALKARLAGLSAPGAGR